MGYENNEKKNDTVYSKRIKAGKRRTYFFDVRETRGSDYFLTITESRKRFDSDGYDRHKIFLYKEDFNKFVKGLNEAVDHVKTELMPDFDFDSFSHEGYEEGIFNETATEIPATATMQDQVAPTADDQPAPTTTPDASAGDNLAKEEADKW